MQIRSRTSVSSTTSARIAYPLLTLIAALISGVVSGFFGAGIGGLSFMTMHNLLTQKIYAEEKFGWLTPMDFRVKNMIIFLLSDVAASLTKFPFETRKQLVQMANYDIELKILTRNAYLGLAPLMIRDVTFRFLLLGSYYATTNIEHKPQPKYTVPQILDFMKQRRAEGYTDDLKDLQPFFYEYHNYSIKTPYTTRLTILIVSNFVATVLTNPFDVCLSKIMTQNPYEQKVKYNGLIDALVKVYKEEGREKFLSGLHPRFMFNLVNGLMFLFVYDRFTHFVNSIYE